MHIEIIVQTPLHKGGAILKNKYLAKKVQRLMYESMI